MQAGSDAHGDGFAWQHEEFVIETASEKAAREIVALMHGMDIYANECLCLEWAGACTGHMCTISLYNLLQMYRWGIPSKLSYDEQNEFHKRQKDASDEVAIRYFLELRAPQLIREVFRPVPAEQFTPKRVYFPFPEMD
jgi:hypothetical protein